MQHTLSTHLVKTLPAGPVQAPVEDGSANLALQAAIAALFDKRFPSFDYTSSSQRLQPIWYNGT